MRGVAEWMAAADGLVVGVDAAVRKSVQQGALAEKQLIQENMGGPPRWDASRHHRSERGGGPGEITGRLRRSVGYSPVIKVGYGRYRTTIRAKRRYATKTEERYPYFQPGHREATPVQARIFERNIAAAIR